MGTEKPKQREMKGIWVHIGYLENLANITGKIEWLSLSTSILVVEKQNKCFQIDLYEYFHWNSVNKKNIFLQMIIRLLKCISLGCFWCRSSFSTKQHLGKNSYFFQNFQKWKQSHETAQLWNEWESKFPMLLKIPFQDVKIHRLKLEDWKAAAWPSGWMCAVTKVTRSSLIFVSSSKAQYELNYFLERYEVFI